MAAHTLTPHPRGRMVLLSTSCLLALTFLSLLGTSGCTRNFYRKQADKEVEAVLHEKDVDQAWKIEQFHVYPDPRARFADPSNPDRPPMPPDDPGAYDLAPQPQKPGKQGVAYVEGTGYLELLKAWDAENRQEAEAAKAKEKEKAAQDGKAPVVPTLATESQAPEGVPAPQPAAETKSPRLAAALSTPLQRSPDRRPFLLKLEQASEMGLFNSREFQDRREDLYLTALPVTLQRFGFAAQGYFLEQIIREHTGSQTTAGDHNTWRANTTTGFGKLFSTGALLLFQFANRTVVNLTGPGKHTISTSTIDLDIIQPLLRGGGKAVTLEPLTQAERNLLYQVRTYARFRKEFFVSIAGGGGGSISGGVFVPTGVIAPSTVTPSAGFGSSGIVPGAGLNPVAPSSSLDTPPGSSGRLNLSTAIPPNVSGFLGTVLQYAQIAIDEANITNLQGFLEIFEGFKEGGDVSQLQVDQVEQQLLQGRTTLLMDQQQYYDAIDRFKLQLGLPVNVPLELDDAPLRPLNQQFERYSEILQQFAAAGKDAAALGTMAAAPRVREGLRRLFATADIVRGTRFRTEFPPQWAAWEKLSDDAIRKRLEAIGAERRKLLDARTDAESAGKVFPAEGQRRLRQLEFEGDLGSFEQVLRQYETQAWKGEADEARRLRQQATLFRFVLNGFILVLGEARNERLDAVRQSWPEVPRLCVEGTDLLKGDLDEVQAKVAQTAILNRLDLMNVRANLVDAWRQYAVFANALLGTFNLQYHLDTFTPVGQARPLAFSGSRSTNQLIMNFELPLVRMQERNNYRATLIAYQRQRRALMEAEDLVAQSVRGEIRQLRVLAEQYKIQQRQVELAYLTVESSLDTFQAPPAPGAAGDPASRASSLTQQLLNAQRSLPTAQNLLLTNWINYLTLRLQLYRDLELMPLDQRGVWLDDIATCQCSTPAGNQPDATERPVPGSEGPGDGQRPAAGAAQPAAPRPAPEQGR
jgi:outer membrane protein TolC